MPPKQGPTTFGGLTAREFEHLGHMASIMGDLPEIDWTEFARRTNVKHGKNAKQGMKKIFDKLKVSAGDEDASGSDEENGEESPSPKKAAKKAPVKKAAVKKVPAKKTAAKEEKAGDVSDVPTEIVGDDEVEEKSPPKKALRATAVKKNAVAPKAAVKKTVGRSVAPKKASEGGPKPKSTKTKAGSKVTKVVEAGADVEVEADADADTEGAQLSDANVKEDAEEELKVEDQHLEASRDTATIIYKYTQAFEILASIMAPASNEEQFKFLISCIRYSNNGKVDFGQVAKECKIVSKGAAAKRYERMMRAHGIASNAATIKPAPSRTPKPEIPNNVSHTARQSSSPSKKRKGDHFLDENPADDDEGYGNMSRGMMSIKSDPAERDSKEHLFIKEEDQKLNLEQAAALMQYYDNSASSQYSEMPNGIQEGYDGDYLGVMGSMGQFAAAPTAARNGYGHMDSGYGIQTQDRAYGFGYGSSSMSGMPRVQQQSFQYEPSLPWKVEESYESAEPGNSQNPVTVE